MNKQIFLLIFIISTSLLSSNTYAQKQKKIIYFLVDTISTIPENKFIEIGTEGPLNYILFLCKCQPPYNKNLTFAYNPSEQKTITSKTRPNYKFHTWKEFYDIVMNSGNTFNDHYDLMVTEVLPNKHYKTSKVFQVQFRELLH